MCVDEPHDDPPISKRTAHHGKALEVLTNPLVNGPRTGTQHHDVNHRSRRSIASHAVDQGDL